MTEAVESIAQSCAEEPKLVLNRNVTSDQLEKLAMGLLDYPQVEMPLEHHFAPGVYLRQITMPAGTFVIGAEHKTTHHNIVVCGRARVLMNGVVTEVIGPTTFVSGDGVRKVLYILEDMKWITIHKTDTTDVQKLEEELVYKSDAFKLLEREKKQLIEGAK